MCSTSVRRNKYGEKFQTMDYGKHMYVLHEFSRVGKEFINVSTLFKSAQSSGRWDRPKKAVSWPVIADS